MAFMESAKDIFFKFVNWVVAKALHVLLNWTVFLLCAYLSATFAVQLYSGLVDAQSDKDLLSIGAMVVEGIKILALIMANTALFSLRNVRKNNLEAFKTGAFSNKNLKNNPDYAFLAMVLHYRDLRKTFYTFITIYLFCALITVGGSFGFILTHVALRGEAATAITSTAITTSNDDKITENKDTIKTNKGTISQNDLTIADLRKQKNGVDNLTTLTDDQKQIKKDSLQGKIQKLLDTNTGLTSINQKLSDDNIKLATTSTSMKQVDENKAKAIKKDMYDLMSDAFGGKISSASIRMTLLSMFATAIELGLFFFSPHFSSMEEATRTTAPTPAPRKREEDTLEAEAPVPAVVAPVIVRQPAPKGRALAEEFVAFAPTPIDEPVEISNPAPVIEPEIEEPVEELGVAQEAVSLAQPEETVVPEAPLLVPEVKVLTSTRQAQMDAFIEALFDTKGKSELVDRDVAIKASGVPVALGREVFDFLVTHKKGGFNLIQFDAHKSFFYPLHHASVVKKEVTDHFLGGSPASGGEKV